jgi:tetratricopeptide (TPR) repeat protein
MPIRVTCPKCGTTGMAPDNAIGKKARCRNKDCQLVFEIGPAGSEAGPGETKRVSASGAKAHGTPDAVPQAKSKAVSSSRQEPSSTEHQDALKVDKAWGQIQAGNLGDAETVLLDVASRSPAPDQYAVRFSDGDTLYVKTWDQSESVAYSAWYLTLRPSDKGGTVRLVCLGSAYPRAYHYLGYIAIERKDMTAAMAWFEKAKLLEPDSPKILCELGAAHGSLGSHAEALKQYETVASLRRPVSSHDMAVALRGAGCQLI